MLNMTEINAEIIEGRGKRQKRKPARFSNDQNLAFNPTDRNFPSKMEDPHLLTNPEHSDILNQSPVFTPNIDANSNSECFESKSNTKSNVELKSHAGSNVKGGLKNEDDKEEEYEEHAIKNGEKMAESADDVGIVDEAYCVGIHLRARPRRKSSLKAVVEDSESEDEERLRWRSSKPRSPGRHSDPEFGRNLLALPIDLQAKILSDLPVAHLLRVSQVISHIFYLRSCKSLM